MKKIATLLLCICLGLPIVSALGSCGCRHPENKLELRSTHRHLYRRRRRTA